MPNWCYNQTIFYGDENKTRQLYKELKESVPKVATYEYNDHVDHFFKLLGVPQERLDKDLNCRAHIVDIALLDKGELSLCYESAWVPIIEDLNYILKEYQPNLKQVTMSEECGEGIFVNTDREGLYFIDKYYIDMSNEDDDYNDQKYHDSLESVIAEFKEFYGVEDEITTKEELEEKIEYIKELYDDIYITFEELTDY